MEWRPIFKQSSLPYNEGEEFYARYNRCVCGTEDPMVVKCMRLRTCIMKFKVLNELSFLGFSGNKYNLGMEYGKQGIIQHFKYWKMIPKTPPPPHKLIDIFKLQNKVIAEEMLESESNVHRTKQV